MRAGGGERDERGAEYVSGAGVRRGAGEVRAGVGTGGARVRVRGSELVPGRAEGRVAPGLIRITGAPTKYPSPFYKYDSRSMTFT